ncbi:unnamed protein product, partial [Cyprideis torosa]
METKKQAFLSRGPLVYELFSVMVHSGSAAGGHYYAYIKDFTSELWFCFNDSSVTQASYEDVMQTFGGSSSGSRSYYTSSYISSTNAYMLFYRQVDPTRNAKPLQENEFPQHLKGLMREMQEEEQREAERRQTQLSLQKITVFSFTPPN